MSIQNNITRFLKSQKINFTEFETDPIKHSAIESAEIFHLDPMIVYKTIVVLRVSNKHGKPMVVVIPGPCEVSVKKVADFINEKKVQVPTQKEAEDLTGMLSGGISPFGLLNHGFEIYASNIMLSQNLICVSGGQRGLSLQMKPEDFIKVTNAKLGDFTE